MVFMISGGLAVDRLPRLEPGVENLLVRAKISGNLESFGKGLRGAVDHMIYDLQRAEFVRPSQYYEYGVGFQQDLGVVPEDKAAWWTAEWAEPVQANLIALSGVYPNQPQPDTAWKIEIRQDGNWKTHAAGVGGWYNSGRYVWGGVATQPIAFDAIRFRVFSKDDATPIKSIHFRGEAGRSWMVARVTSDDVIMPAPFQARITPLTAPVMAGRPVTLDGSGSTIAEADFAWDFGDSSQAMGKQAEHVFREAGIRKVTLTVSDGKHKHVGMAIVREFNGNNDPWSMYVVAHSGVETWIVPAPVGARVAIDKRTEGHLYADHPLGQYLKQIVPAKQKGCTMPARCRRSSACGWTWTGSKKWKTSPWPGPTDSTPGRAATSRMPSA
jgi:hypothetical protein